MDSGLLLPSSGYMRTKWKHTSIITSGSKVLLYKIIGGSKNVTKTLVVAPWTVHL